MGEHMGADFTGLIRPCRALALVRRAFPRTNPDAERGANSSRLEKYPIAPALIPRRGKINVPHRCFHLADNEN
jgi:hypothetical protein